MSGLSSNSNNSGAMAVIVSAVMGIIGGMLGAGVTVYLDKAVSMEFDSRRYFENAYYQALSAKETVEGTIAKTNDLPIHKLIYGGIDWSNIFLETQDDNFSTTYIKLSYLDDLRDKIFQTTDLKDREVLCTEYWKQFDELKKSGELTAFTDKLNYYRQSSKEKRRQAEIKRQQEEFQRHQD